MRHLQLFSALILVSALTATDAQAQMQSTAWGRNGYVSFNGLYRNEGLTFTDRLTFDVNEEAAAVRAGHNVEPGPVFDISSGGRIVGNLGLGFALSYIRQREVVGVNADIPHPFYFNQPRRVIGSAADVRHEQIAVHTSVMWLVPFSETVQLAVFGGPTYFKLKQAMVSAVQFSDEYPFDQAAYTGSTTVDTRGSKVGYNAGIDVSVFFSEYIGIGGLIRFSRADVDLPSPSGGDVSVEAGGLQSGAGFRVRF